MVKLNNELYNKPAIWSILTAIIALIPIGFNLSSLTFFQEIIAVFLIIMFVSYKLNDNIDHLFRFKYAIYLSAIILIKDLLLKFFSFDDVYVLDAFGFPFLLLNFIFNFWLRLIYIYLSVFFTNKFALYVINKVRSNPNNSIVRYLTRIKDSFIKVFLVKKYAILASLIIILVIFVYNLVPKSNIFVRAGHFNDIRFSYTTTMLDDKNILIIGGTNDSINSKKFNNVDIYNPINNKIIKSGKINEERYNHSATLLKDGRILLTGGYGKYGEMSSSEIYNPKTKKSIKMPNMHYSRQEHSAVLLKNGKVLIVGGHQTLIHKQKQINNIAEIFDPVANKFCKAPKMNYKYFRRPFVVTLNNGKVFIAGGYKKNGKWGFPESEQRYAELYDPEKNTFVSLGKMIKNHSYGTATLLKDGRVILIGGNSADKSNKATKFTEIFDPKTRSFKLAALLNDNRLFHTATLLKNGKILITGGETTAVRKTNYLYSAEIYDPNKNKFYKISNMVTPRAMHLAILLPNGNVILFGGFNKKLSIEQYLYKDN